MVRVSSASAPRAEVGVGQGLRFLTAEIAAACLVLRVALASSWQSCQACFQPPSIAVSVCDRCVSAPGKTDPQTLSVLV